MPLFGTALYIQLKHSRGTKRQRRTWQNITYSSSKFIEQDKEYIDANVIYAQQFNAFLLDQLGLQFSNSKYGASAEKVLIALRNAKKYGIVLSELRKRGVNK